MYYRRCFLSLTRGVFLLSARQVGDECVHVRVYTWIRTSEIRADVYAHTSVHMCMCGRMYICIASA